MTEEQIAELTAILQKVYDSMFHLSRKVDACNGKINELRKAIEKSQS